MVAEIRGNLENLQAEIDAFGDPLVGTQSGQVPVWSGSEWIVQKPERVVTLGVSGAITSNADSSDFYVPIAFAATIKRMKVTAVGVTTNMTVQLRKSTDSGASFADVSAFTVTFASGNKIKTVDPTDADVNEDDILNVSCGTVSGTNLLVALIVVAR